MSDQKVVQKGGVGICGWMFLIFLTLKLTGYIAWSWWWVTAPLWMPITIVVGICLVAFVGYCITELVTKK